jgi:hypothetical protein
VIFAVLQETNMIEFIKVCGIVGIVILLLTPVLLLVDVLIAVLCKSRKPLAIFAVVAFIPLLLGLLGTAAGYSQVRRVSQTLESPDIALIQHGRAQARYTTYLGAGSTGLLLLIVVMGMAQKKKAVEPAPRHVP